VPQQSTVAGSTSAVLGTYLGNRLGDLSLELLGRFILEALADLIEQLEAPRSVAFELP
jgi:hypothetical protein